MGRERMVGNPVCAPRPDALAVHLKPKALAMLVWIADQFYSAKPFALGYLLALNGSGSFVKVLLPHPIWPPELRAFDNDVEIAFLLVFAKPGFESPGSIEFSRSSDSK